MKLPPPVLATRARFVAAFPVPQIATNEADDAWTARIRAWSIQLAEQIAFSHPGDGYAVKRGDSGRPVCKDCLAQKTATSFVSWDMLLAASGGTPTLVRDPDSLDLSGPPDGPQFFEDWFVDYPRRSARFRPQNHLATVIPPRPPTAPDPPRPAARKTLAEYFAFATGLRALYYAELRRDILLDPDAQANWTYHWREDGRDLGWIRADIRTSDEWHLVHPS